MPEKAFPKANENTEQHPDGEITPSGRSSEKQKQHTETVNNWLQELRRLASEVMNQLTPEELEHLTELLMKCARLNTDPRISFLYGALDTILNTDRGVLLKQKTIGKVLERAAQINAELHTKEKITNYAEYLTQYLAEWNEQNIDPNIQRAIKKCLEENKQKDWPQAIPALLNKLGLQYDQEATFNAKFLFALNPNKDAELLAKLESKLFPYEIYELKSKNELIKESEVLNHCAGRSDFYINQVRRGKILVLALRENGIPKWTLEYNIKRQSIVQFKGGGDVPVNSLPNNRDLVLETLKALKKSNIPVKNISENFEYSILYDKTRAEYFTQETLKAQDVVDIKELKVIRGTIIVNEDIDLKTARMLGETEGLSLDLTNADQQIKAEITEIQADLIDNSSTCKYPKLTKVGGDIGANNATRFEMNALTSVGGDIWANNATRFEMNALTSVGGSIGANNATRFEMNALTSVGGDIWASKATSFEMNALTSVGGSIWANNATSFKMNALTSVGGDIWPNNATRFEMNALTSVGGDIWASKATSFEMNALTSVGGDIWANNATSFEMNALTSVGGDIWANNATSFEMNALTSVGGSIGAFNATSFKMNALTSVGGNLKVKSAMTLILPSLITVNLQIFFNPQLTFLTAPKLQTINGKSLEQNPEFLTVWLKFHK